MRARLLVLAITALGAGCIAPPQAILLCHNANCGSTYSDRGRDDSLEGLTESLALRYQGRPAIDGVELDTVWDPQAARCLFAHDLTARATAPDAHAAGELVAAHIDDPREVAFGGRFYVKIELKPDGLDRDDVHRDAHRAGHAACVIDVLERLRDAAGRHAHPLTVIFAAEDPSIFGPLAADPRFPADDPDVLLEAGLYAAVPGDVQIDLLTLHWTEARDASRAEISARHAAMDLWGRTTSPEMFRIVEWLSPEYLNTNEAILFRQWLDPGA